MVKTLHELVAEATRATLRAEVEEIRAAKSSCRWQRGIKVTN